MSLVEVKGLTKSYSLDGGGAFGGSRKDRLFHAVDDVSFTIERGEVLGLVGESGSGKSTLGRLLLNLIPPTAGQVLFEGENLFTLPMKRMRALRLKMQVIFQDPYASLNPRMTVAETLVEGIRQAGVAARQEQRSRAADLLEAVGLNAGYLDRYPHMFSGGQRQRIAVARALSVQPELIVADEPVSALDVSVQAQVLNLLADLRSQFNLTYLFVSHDLNVIRYLSDRVAVMHRGRLVELAPADALFAAPRHPYTRALLDAAPRISFGGGRPETGEAARPERGGDGAYTVVGCRYRHRCPLAVDACRTVVPEWMAVRPDHWVACHVAQTEAGQPRPPTLDLAHRGRSSVSVGASASEEVPAGGDVAP